MYVCVCERKKERKSAIKKKKKIISNKVGFTGPANQLMESEMCIAGNEMCPPM